MDWMLSVMTPSIQTRFQNYFHQDIRGDLAAGLTVGVLLVPQAMAYAMLAGLPPVTGLYAATIPVLAYALTGSSRQLAVGPVAIISLLVYTGCAALAEPGSTEFTHLVLLLAVLTGIIQIGLGLFRMGFLINFVSRAVISGFTTAAAILIAASQMKYILGVTLPGASNGLTTLIQLARSMTGCHGATAALGAALLILSVAVKRLAPRLPGSLVTVIIGTLSVGIFRLDTLGISIVGHVPRGLPRFSLPTVNLSAAEHLLPVALAIVFVGYMESMAIAEVCAARHRYKLNPNREFTGLGLANLAAAFFSGYPVAGGLARTAVNNDAGARTRLAGIYSAGIVALTLMLFTPLFYYLPDAALAAVIITAVAGLVDIREARRLFRLKHADGWTYLLTFSATFFWSVERGILLGIALSLFLFIWRSAHPHIAELGYWEQCRVFRNLKRFPESRRFPGIAIFRVDASIYFANAGFIEDHLRHYIHDHPGTSGIILDLSAVNDMDAGGLRTLEDMLANYAARRISLLLAGMKGPIRDLARRAGWPEQYGEQIAYRSVFGALRALGHPVEERLSPDDIDEFADNWHAGMPPSEP